MYRLRPIVGRVMLEIFEVGQWRVIPQDQYPRETWNETIEYYLSKGYPIRWTEWPTKKMTPDVWTRK